MQLLRVEDCGNCKTSVERICQVHVGWECCRYLLNVRLPTLVLGLLTQFTGDNKNNDVIKHILPVGMLVSWYPDTHIYHLNESVKWQVRWNKIALAVVLEIVCCLLRSLRDGRAIHFFMVEILKDKVLPSWVSGLRSICSTINVENLLTFWDPVLLFIKILNWHWYRISGTWSSAWNVLEGVAHGSNWNRWPQNSKMTAS